MSNHPPTKKQLQLLSCLGLLFLPRVAWAHSQGFEFVFIGFTGWAIFGLASILLYSLYSRKLVRAAIILIIWICLCAGFSELNSSAWLFGVWLILMLTIPFFLIAKSIKYFATRREIILSYSTIFITSFVAMIGMGWFFTTGCESCSGLLNYSVGLIVSSILLLIWLIFLEARISTRGLKSSRVTFILILLFLILPIYRYSSNFIWERRFNQAAEQILFANYTESPITIPGFNDLVGIKTEFDFIYSSPIGCYWFDLKGIGGNFEVRASQQNPILVANQNKTKGLHNDERCRLSYNLYPSWFRQQDPNLICFEKNQLSSHQEGIEPVQISATLKGVVTNDRAFLPSMYEEIDIDKPLLEFIQSNSELLASMKDVRNNWLQLSEQHLLEAGYLPCPNTPTTCYCKKPVD